MDDSKRKAWVTIRYGRKGTYVNNTKNGRRIVKNEDYIDTVFPRCKCYEKGAWTGKILAGEEAVDWLFEEKGED